VLCGGGRGAGAKQRLGVRFRAVWVQGCGLISKQGLGAGLSAVR
jgi:hypothetical protein